jgi:ADP-glucose type glycogen/starch synthase
MIDANFPEGCYPLGIQCGRQPWESNQLTAHFGLAHRPQKTWFRQLLADYLRTFDKKSLTAGELELWSTLNLVLKQVASVYLFRRNSRLQKQNHLEIAGKLFDLTPIEQSFPAFIDAFPAVPVELQQCQGTELRQQLKVNRQLQEFLLELVLLYVQKNNPALKGAAPLFSNEEERLNRLTNYRKYVLELNGAIPEVDDGFASQPVSLLERLLQPLKQATTLYEQLQLLRNVWGAILPEELLARISTALIQFEREGIIPDFPGEPQLEALDPAAFADQEYANFTADIDWMPRTVLLAKSVYVWLEQLSRKYRREVRRLDQIPDSELDDLAEYGFTSLWLIGIWKRSKASLKIKNLCGQIQVAASAYAIDDYHVADDLGGEEGLRKLRNRCRARGIDLACDVVTNHTGIESAWMREHPDWFIQLPNPPYPGYTFSGPDLSEDTAYAIQIEDGYFDHSEAAVVCRYQNRSNKEERFIYHGNDGTHLPWNDTAQLNYLLPQVREAMIRLIIRVAKDFRIIRFDAAMTLAKRHFQRLWYPLPGGGEGVPSRSDHALSRDEFNRVFPVEFWRELVDRIRDEAPDTLLVAEAFWLMEGYFVRTLGMHRVYNSAFMNMLKTEENGKYRQTIQNILAFDPAILQRFVNFMSNPDEKPAIEQFGDGDKYFCVATLLATMPGLPMFGHGQIEGFTEKYGMEYLTPRWNEEPCQELIERHRRQLFPLLRRRALFSGSERFQLYDFISAYGVEQDVFAYSNGLGDERVLILCNNSPKQISGHIGAPVPMAERQGMDVLDACSIDTSSDFVLLHDRVTDCQQLQPAQQLHAGGTFNLQPYDHRVLSGFEALHDSDGRWQTLWQRFGSEGRKNLFLDRDALLIEDLWQPSWDLLDASDPATEQITTLLTRYADLPFDPHWLLQVQLYAGFGVELNSNERSQLTTLLEDCLPLTKSLRFKLFDALFHLRSIRGMLKSNYYDYCDWFGLEDFRLLTQIVLQQQLTLASRGQEPEEDCIADVLGTLELLQQTLDFIEQDGCNADQLLQKLEVTRCLIEPIPAAEDGLKILFVASEATPFAKTGGLADVVGSLPRALRLLGHDVQIAIPCYTCAKERPIPQTQGERSIEIRLQGKPYRAAIKHAVYDGVPFWLIDTPEFFERDALYGDADGDYADNGLRFGFFSKAVLELAKLQNFAPDLIHLHDWQSSLIPALLKTSYRDQKFFRRCGTLLTIHNLGYQGQFPMGLLDQLELPGELAESRGLEYFGRLSALKGGINYSDRINTVSPTYCEEVQRPEYGHGFDGLLRDRSADLCGIINGLDGRIWNPQDDPLLEYHFSATDLKGKQRCKEALQRELGLKIEADIPIVAVVSRLDRQKGMDLIQTIWSQLLQRRVQFVLLGSGHREMMKFWQTQQGQYPGQVSISLVFNEALSHRIFAASDILLVPSLYEPCGLTQMIALQYGALPVARHTGGLADTVIDIDSGHKDSNGFVFNDSDPWQLLHTIDRALNRYLQRERWDKLVKKAMQQDFSWTNSAEQYLALYRQIIDDQRHKQLETPQLKKS